LEEPAVVGVVLDVVVDFVPLVVAFAVPPAESVLLAPPQAVVVTDTAISTTVARTSFLMIVRRLSAPEMADAPAAVLKPSHTGGVRWGTRSKL
jgi:hypothetical protein